jgi:hypothetical protein
MCVKWSIILLINELKISPQHFYKMIHNIFPYIFLWILYPLKWQSQSQSADITFQHVCPILQGASSDLLYTSRVMVSTVRLALCHFFLHMVAWRDILLLSPGSPATSTGLQYKLVSNLHHKYYNSDTDINTWKCIISNSNLFFFVLDQSHELNTSTEEQRACNNSVM